MVTGLGCVSPLGLSVESTWRAALAGQSGVAALAETGSEDFAVQIAAEVKNFDVSAYLDRKAARKVDTFIQFGIAAADEALENSGLDLEQLDATRIGCAVGSGIGGLPMIEDTKMTLENRGPRKVSPFFVPSTIINMVAGQISIRHGLQGPNTSVVTACATGTHNIGEAGRMIRYGDADVMLAGGAEACISPLTLSSFAAAKALSTRNDDPAAASRPFDAERDGFVMGEGAGVLVLEEYEHAVARGATIYAELAGFGMSADAHHITQPPEDGSGAARCMQSALNDAQYSKDRVDYINAHGTSTPAGDLAETRAIHRVFGDHAQRLAVSSTKSMTGHLLGAAGGLEAVFSVLALHDGVLPPTINLDSAGEGCDLDYVPHKAREQRVRCSLSNSFGFGGTNASLIFTAL
ncbi:3-oxoacyl-(acyl-carrier-protein) synthase 2 [gamma proteobacterium HTCC5015]|nr:3-oxoacyl-(acyl-carrier-protein) synthase 2 [gamma proteobacterium HTCC5015]